MSTLFAGVSRRNINPNPGIYLMGYGNRVQGNVGIHDDLFITTIVFADEQHHRVALVTADHTFINHHIVQAIESRLVNDLRLIQPNALFVCCSHSHSAPIGYADEKSPPEAQTYITFLMQQIIASVQDAVAALEPVTLHVGQGSADININRREKQADGTIIIGNNRDGLVDHSIGILQVRGKESRAVATLVNYACHPVTLGPRNRLASADWVGAMRERLEARSPGYCLFVQGATADINPRRMTWERDNWDEVREQGYMVADGVLSAVSSLVPLKGYHIHFTQETRWLPLVPVTDYQAMMQSFVPNAKDEAEIRQTIRREFPWYTRLQPKPHSLGTSALTIGAVRIGEWGLATIEAEVFTQTGQHIKQHSPAKHTFVAGYTNGCNSYLATQEAHNEGGYEVNVAPLFFGLPGTFAPGSAETVAARLIKLLHV